MKRLLAWVLGALVLVGSIAIGAVTFAGTVEADSAVIANYDAAYTLASNGDLHAVETLTFNFPDPKHGIFRFFDTRDKNDARHRFLPEHFSVTRDGHPEPFARKTEKRGRFETFKIGSADRTIVGQHVYRLSYDVRGTLSKGNGTRSQFYWNVIPEGWRNPIESSRVVVHLPAVVRKLQCAVGAGDTSSACQASGEGTRAVTVRTGPLQPNTPVTISSGLDLPVPADKPNSLPWNSQLDPFLGRHLALLVLVVLIAAAVAIGGILLSVSTQEEEPAFPLMYAPPDGVGPAEAAYILDERVDNKAYIGTLMYAAEQGMINLEMKDSAWTATGAQDTEAWSRTDQVTQLTAQSLGITAPGASFTASPKSVSAGQKLKSSLSSFSDDTRGWALTNGLMVRSGLGGAGIVVLLIAWGLVIFLGAFNPLNMSVVALIPGAFAITATDIGLSGAGTKRTAAGRDLWSRVGGFKRILSTDSAQERFDFSGRKELYTAYLPWAVAFDCADEWAKKYQLQTGEEPPTPTYFAGYSGFYAGSAINSMVDTFDSSVSSAISAYDATQSSSSSGGGGGFSGGGGGGGGGGGSW